MYHHVKKLMYTVNIGTPEPRFGNMLLEQFGGANGELAAAMQYSIQGLNCEDSARKDLLMDIGTEELSHLEIVGALIRMHLKPMKSDRDAAEADPLVAIAGGGGVALFNSMGDAWTADYLKITGELDVDLRSNIVAEARAKIVYERLDQLHRWTRERKEALQNLMTREITWLRAFHRRIRDNGQATLLHRDDGPHRRPGRRILPTIQPEPTRRPAVTMFRSRVSLRPRSCRRWTSRVFGGDGLNVESRTLQCRIPRRHPPADSTPVGSKRPPAKSEHDARSYNKKTGTRSR